MNAATNCFQKSGTVPVFGNIREISGLQLPSWLQNNGNAGEIAPVSAPAGCKQTLHD
jgi:hypothetical protein